MDIEQELARLGEKVKALMLEELAKGGIKYDSAEARVRDVRTVGVQGDAKTYGYLAELSIFYEGKFVWNAEFLADLSNKITNNIKEVNRVAYTLSR